MGMFQRLAGTVASFFQIGGPGGPGWNDNAGVLEARNAANSGFVVVRGAPPVASNDLVTLGSLTSLAGVVNTIRIPIALATVSSTNTIPAGAIIRRCTVNVSTLYSAGATIAVGTSATANLFQLTTDNDPQVVGVYDVLQDTSEPTALAMQVTIAGAPAAGAGFVAVDYVEPLN
jgi:hypothetical protein